VEQVPEGFEQGSVEVEEIFKVEDQRPGFAERNRESPLIVRSERSCEGVNSQAHKESGHRISTFGVWRGKSLPVEIASRDFPNQREPSIGAKSRGARSRGVGESTFGVSLSKNTRIVDPGSAKSRGDVASGDHEI
jgi:hypothetical protein